MAKKSDTEKNINTAVAAISEREGKLPPQDVDIEEAVLGALMLDNDAFQEVVEILKPEHFYIDKHQRIFSAMVRLNVAQTPIDMLTVANELKRTEELTSVGGRIYLAQLTERVAAAINIEHHARIIFQKYLQRSLISLGNDLQNDGYDETKDVQDMLDEAEEKLFNLTQGSMKREVQQIAPIVEEARRQMEEAAKRTDGISGITSGFDSIDKITSGWQPSTMVVVAARPAMGKTAFVLSMIRKMAVNNNIPVAMFSLEMSNVELVKRMMTAETEITSDKIKRGRLTADEWTHFNSSITALTQAPIYIDDTPGLSIFDLRSKARILHKKYNIKIIVIDYLQLMTASAARPGNRQEEVSMISRSLKGLAKELGIPVVALSQLNRSVEQRGVGGREGSDSKRPQLSDLRESGAIEQDADMVCFIHRPEYYGIKTGPDGESLEGKAEFIIAKHRSGPVADVLLRFEAPLIRFEEDSSSQTSHSHPMPMTTQSFETFTSKMNVPQDPTFDSSQSFPDFNTSSGDDAPAF